MRGRSVVVLGAGMAGLSSALLLARSGHRVTLVDRDDLDVGAPLDAVGWSRKGLPHFLLPHAFIPRGRVELMRLLPDVYDALIAAGAHDVDCRPKLPGDPRPGDEVLQYLAVRRPLIEWGLRRAVAAEAGIEPRALASVQGLIVDGGRVTGAVVNGEAIPADLVVDALGRRTSTAGWLAAAGVDTGNAQSSDCGVVYYCRYYRQRPGFALPDGPWLLSPRGDLGYCAYATFPGDNGTLAGLLAVPPRIDAWRGLHQAAAFEAAVAAVPPLRSWCDPAGVDPISDVLPMAGLRNTIRPPVTVPGLLPVGDALAHTDPVLAHGLAFALIHAAALVDALAAYDDVGDVGSSYDADVRPAVEERFALATDLDEQRLRMWSGESVDYAHRDGDYALFSLAAAGAAAGVDGDVARVFARRIGLIDSTSVLDKDIGMQERIEDIFAEVGAMPRPPVGPSAEQMLSLVSAHG